MNCRHIFAFLFVSVLLAHRCSADCFVIEETDCSDIISTSDFTCSDAPCVESYGVLMCTLMEGWRAKDETQDRAERTPGGGSDSYQSFYDGTPVYCSERQTCTNYFQACVGETCIGGSWNDHGIQYYPQILTGVLCVGN